MIGVDFIPGMGYTGNRVLGETHAGQWAIPGRGQPGRGGNNHANASVRIAGFRGGSTADDRTPGPPGTRVTGSKGAGQGAKRLASRLAVACQVAGTGAIRRRDSPERGPLRLCAALKAAGTVLLSP